jgi:hypothetical protein
MLQQKDNVGCETGIQQLQLHCSICLESTKYDGRNGKQIVELWLTGGSNETCRQDDIFINNNNNKIRDHHNIPGKMH